MSQAERRSVTITVGPKGLEVKSVPEMSIVETVGLMEVAKLAIIQDA